MTVFPFGLPGSTPLYLCLYLATLALHFAFMGYVLAGSGYVAISALRSDARPSAVAPVLRDWLPFALGTAITAGVAPLLFLQVLYQEHFYTANLLLFYRWVAVVPVLIAGFYLLYLQKSDTAAGFPTAIRRTIPIAAFLCFAFTGYSWTENHLLSMDRAAWKAMYAAGEHVYFSEHSIPRTLFFLASAVPTMCAIVGWQMRHLHSDPNGANDDDAEAAERTARHLGLLATLGIVASTAAGLIYGLVIGADVLSAVAEAVGSVTLYWGLIAVGTLVQLAAWIHVWRAGALGRRALWAASVGASLTIVGVLAVRESMRAAAVDLAHLSADRLRVAEADGMVVFLVFAALAIAVIAWCFRMIARALRS